ncbi:MAG: S9 family peptidase [Bacteroidota bacterium]
MEKIKTIIIYLSLSILFSAAYAQEKENFTATKIWQMERVGSPDVSPDGKWVVFTVTAYDIESNSSETNLHLLNLENDKERQITFSGKDGNPVWSPDGKKIAFVSGRNEQPGQIYILDLEMGGEAKQITELPVSTFSLQWFPDGKKIAFGANILPEYNGDFEKLDSLIKEKKESKISAKATENTMYRFWDKWLTDGYLPSLFSVNINTNEVIDLLPGDYNYFGMMGGVSYDIAPDGEQIALSRNSTPPPYDKLNYDIFLLKTDGSGQITNITADNEASDANPLYSPDGKFLIYGKQDIFHFYADKMVMTRYDLGKNTSEEISQNIDLSAGDWILTPDGKTVFFTAEYKAQNSVFKMPSKGGKHQLIFEPGSNGNLHLGGNNKQNLLFTHHNLNKPVEIFTTDLNGENLKQRTHFNDDSLQNTKMGKVDNVTFKGANDADVQMFIVYPPDFDESKKYPLVLMIHGGPHGVFGDTWHYRWNAHLFAEPGYVVAMPNFHGSTSFGQDFAISIHGEHANQPFEDIMNATDYMIEKDYIDETRMAATGGSYGGYMVSWIAGQTDRYAALVNHAGVYDLHLQFASDYGANRGYQYGGTPWENYDVLNSQNPSQFAANFKTPMLVIHGELDYRVPVAQGLLVYGIYKARGLDARLVYYPDENHWILQPQNSIYWYEELHNWLERYLKP